MKDRRNPGTDILVVLLGLATILLMTQNGIWLSPDSVSYISAARNLLNGQGLKIIESQSGMGELVPLTQYPPLYPSLLALTAVLKTDPVKTAGWFNALLFGANLLLLVRILRALIDSKWIILFGFLLFWSSIPFLTIHLWAYSEPLFIFLELWGLYLLARYLKDMKLSTLASAALIIGLSFMTRYAGAALVITGMVVLFSGVRRSFKRKSMDVAFFIILSCSPVLLWIIRNIHVADRAASRRFAYHPVSMAQLEIGLRSASGLLMPAAYPRILSEFILLSGFVVLVSGYILLRRKTGQADISSSEVKYLTFTLLVFILTYGLFLVVSKSFFDAATPFSERILSPPFIAALLAGVFILNGILLDRKKRRWVPPLIATLCVFFVFSASVQSFTFMKKHYNNPMGYSHPAWKSSETIQKVRTLAPGILIISNAPDAVYLLTGRPSGSIPSKIDSGTLRINESYPSEIEELKRKLQHKGGVVVYFDLINWRWYLPTEDELMEQLGLQLSIKTSDGSIYKLKGGL
jgi:hypothetical protein